MLDPTGEKTRRTKPARAVERQQLSQAFSEETDTDYTASLGQDLENARTDSIPRTSDFTECYCN